jgi:glycosyltransferase involved in cell wall biosynthesis
MNDVGKINFSKIFGIFRVSKEIKKQFKEFNPDIVYFMPALAGLGLIRDFYFIKTIKKHLHGPILFHVRERITKKDWSKSSSRNLYEKIFTGNKAIVLDKCLRRDLHNSIQQKDIFVLPNAIKNKITIKEFSKIINTRKKKKTFNILFLSNMDRAKGWPKLLKACKILKQKNINFKCNLVGAWQANKDEKEFKNFVKANSLQKQVFSLGKKIREDKNEILKNSDILVFPTEYKPETFGRVIIEAMMFGLPVIANGIAAIPNIIQHKKTGFVLKENAPEEIADYIIKLQDEKLREKMGKAGRKRFLKEYEIKKYSKKFESILNKV